jgi:hypothetical protein
MDDHQIQFPPISRFPRSSAISDGREAAVDRQLHWSRLSTAGASWSSFTVQKALSLFNVFVDLRIVSCAIGLYG